MKNQILLLFIFLCISTIGYAQICGTPEPDFNTQQQQQSNSNQNNTTNNSSVCINVFFHIVRDNNGTGGINTNQLTLIIDDLNSFYNNHDIFFINSGFDYIDNTSFQQIGGSTEAASLAQVNNFSNSINYYIVDTLWDVGSGFVTGTAISIPSNNLVIRQDRVLTSTSSHEIGHCLDLYHTHETFFGIEAINGSNCSSAGDKVCDTPADPNLSGAVNSNCVYTGGGGYNPLTDNIMSYSSNFCRDEFTNGQGSRMRNSIMNNSLLSQLVSNSCSIPELSSINYLCNEHTIILSNLDGNTATWQTSSNIQIISFTNNTITISPINSFTSGSAWVEATLNTGLVLREEFWIGKPSSIGLIMYSSGGFDISTQNWYQLTAHHQNFNYLEHGSLTYEWQIPYAQLRMDPPRDKVIAVLPTQLGTYPYKLRAKNDCGCSSWITRYFDVANQPGRGDLYISPSD